MSRVYLVDVSSVQREVDWAQVAAHDPGKAFGREEGRIAGAIVKASEGPKAIDPLAAKHLAGALASGLAVGIYHFARVAGGAVEQADRMAAWGVGDDPGELPVWLDVEEETAAARLGGPDALVLWMLSWADRCLERGLRPGIYTALVYAQQWRTASPELLERLSRLPLWCAQYSRIGAWAPSDTDRPARVRPWESADVWQYSGGGPGLPGNTIPGVSGYVDLNLVLAGEDGFARLVDMPGAGRLVTELELGSGGPVHGTHVVDSVLEQRPIGGPFSES